ncbi:hypothetical protein DL98DRAFT_522326 [Cadophora sp. DSE1049]|nr:hypothetical protein DL98DRAFT_522326 [Cadophora sp. DSE1049]
MAAGGLLTVYDAEDAGVDIVFLHGLRGNMTETWTKNGVLWPKELFPKDVPKSRISLFGYDTGITHWDQNEVQRTEIHSDADDLCARLDAERSKTNTKDRPIIFIAHSLGGLVAAQILVHGERREEASIARGITKGLRGLIFLGTPFRGSGSAKPAECVRRVLSYFRLTQQDTLKLLGPDSERLDELTLAFAETLGKRRSSQKPEDQISAFFFFETKPTYGVQIVEPYSAMLPGCGDSAPIDTNHVDICKYDTAGDHGYGLVLSAIGKCLEPLKDAAGPAAIIKKIEMSGNAKVLNQAMDTINITTQNIGQF